MKGLGRRLAAQTLSQILFFGLCAPPAEPILQQQAARPTPGVREKTSPADDCRTLHCYLSKSYLDLFELSPHLEFSASEIAAEKRALEDGRQSCVGEFKARAKQYNEKMEQQQKQLKLVSAKVDDAQRHNLHCDIQNYRAQKAEAELLASHGIPTAYDNMEAKLQLIQEWPAERRKILAEIRDGSYKRRRWGDTKDIGFREIAPGQEKDIKAGQDAIKEMKMRGLMPHEMDNKEVQSYVEKVAQRVAQGSDLRVPLHVTVLDSKEINAFALPGGYLFVERGLLEAAEDESELAGVLGHEIGHDVARHAHKLMKRATFADIFMQSAEIAAIVATGGIASIGMAYALEYGFNGLGLLLDLKLLGVSREYELEADQLGIQYAWNSGYDPTGFIRFSDKVASKVGYARGMSWFRTHPPFYERMVDGEREIMFLPKKQSYVTQSPEFEQMKKALAPVTAQSEKDRKDKPSLLMPEKGCPEPQKADYKAGESIDKICARKAW
jgi:Zn-dependent protease with chaperone function